MVATVSPVSRDFQDGTVERWLAAGARRHEIILSRLMTQFLVLSMAAALVLVYMIIFQAPPEKFLNVEIMPLVFLQGLQGITQGLAIGSISVDKITAKLFAFSSILLAFLHGEFDTRILKQSQRGYFFCRQRRCNPLHNRSLKPCKRKKIRAIRLTEAIS